MPTKEEYQQNPEKYKAKGRAAYAQDKEKIKIKRSTPEYKSYLRDYRQANKDKISKRKREYFKSHPNYREKLRLNNLTRNAAGRQFLDGIRLKYGCCNPSCKWRGEFKPYQLDFHHINPEEKSFCIGMNRGCSKEILIQEINKCTVVCSNCHREISNEELNAANFKRCTE